MDQKNQLYILFGVFASLVLFPVCFIATRKTDAGTVYDAYNEMDRWDARWMRKELEAEERKRLRREEENDPAY